MDNNWAVENLQTIRTLMERSALYRRALAPIMLMAGFLGIIAAAAGIHWRLDSTRSFSVLWLGTAVVAVLGALVIARKQALKDSENFWTPPTRRVAQALLPPLTAGMILGVVFGLGSVARYIDFTLVLPFLWSLLYGCALNAAGFFMPRGVRWFGWVYICVAGAALGFWMLMRPNFEFDGHYLMGVLFGGLHLAYGAYLYLTENKSVAV